jgi:Glycosyltransferase family 36/Putative glucoamylase
VLGLAWAYVAHTDSRFDPETLARFVRAYQRVQPLTIGELWAVAITLRIVLVENLRRAAERIVESRRACAEADELADRLLERGAAEVLATRAELRRLSSASFSREFAVQLIQRLRDHDPSIMPFLAWMDGILANRGTNAEELVRQEHHRQGAMNVTVRNAITSMRLMSSIDWADLFESVSLVDATLRADSDFEAMDFPTRDRYRHAIEELARHSPHSELEVARHVIRTTVREKRRTRELGLAGPRREEDPGHYLISSGRGTFEHALAFRPTLRHSMLRGFVRAGLPGHLGSLTLATACLLAPALLVLASLGVAEPMLWLLALSGALPASEAALTLVNHFVTTHIGPRALPGLALRDGVPARLRTLVVVPTLLTSAEEIEAQIDRLEIHALASPDEDLRFALLSDWPDAATEQAPDDAEQLANAARAIASLNRRHPVTSGGPRFLLLHRRRVFSASEQKWMGWERKRGKLVELNRLLRGATDTTYLGAVDGGPVVPDGVRYVVTLDADTRIPRDAVRRLVGKLAHTLNRPRIDPASGRVVEGHANLQPRVTPSLPTGRDGSLFQRVHSGRGGMDPYAFAVSDVYQDLFGEGSYSGKGAYDVDAFSAALAGRSASVPTPVPRRNQVSIEEARVLRMTARRTWRFFETFVGPDDHMLPPDNFQEDPVPVVAHRTSPTNIGLYLLSVVAARDFGWLGLHEAVDRLEATLGSMERLERFRGHFYNWYATQDQRPLEPRYVSTVDSGNLAGHLIALERACLELRERPFVSPAWRTGLEDTLTLIQDAVSGLGDGRRTQTVTRNQLGEAIGGIARLLESRSDAPDGLADVFRRLLIQSEALVDIARTLCAERVDDAAGEVLAWADALDRSIRAHACDLAAERSVGPSAPDPALRDATRIEARLLVLASRASQLVRDMEFGFLYHPTRQLLSIGYRVSDGELDPSCYDLLASEARLASFVAIAKGDIPVRHWFRLGRALTPVDHGAALISWSGSMFEYLMPSLVMRAPLGSLLEQTSRFIVRRQIRYGRELRMPWGISESAFHARDIELTYQYSNFGVPGLGLKRGLSESAVVAPYATALAAMVDPRAALRNFERLERAGGRGRYGWYEALDYTPSRLPEGQTVVVVRAYMAHHQGMTLVSILNALQDGRMRTRFHADPAVRATDLLLQERTPRDVAVARPRAEEVDAAENVRELVPAMLRRFHTPHDVTPRTHLLSNGRYAVMLTAAGSGYSRWGAIAVTRWREDVTCDDWGSYVFLRDIRSGEVWSAGHQPSGAEADAYEVSFAEDRVEILRRDGSLATTLAVTVSTEDDAEVRRVSISNLGTRVREIELTSYAELVLLSPAADAAHPAFSKLFVQTEFVADVGALLATRRRRSPDEAEIWAGHLVVVEGEALGEVQYETDRARFLGRGHGVRNPISVIDGRALSGSVGTVLDPIFSLRRRVRIAPGATARVAFWTLVAPSREQALDLVDKHHDPAAFERAVTLAWTQAQVQLRHLGIDPNEAQLFQRLANRVLYSDPTLRPASDVLRRCPGGAAALWPHGISGDRPIVLVRIDDIEDLAIVRQLLRAHEYWRMKRLAVDLVILNERHA